jgi:hypothetical protein
MYFEITGSKKAPKSEQIGNFYREFIALFPEKQDIEQPKDWGAALHLLKDVLARLGHENSPMAP